MGYLRSLIKLFIPPIFLKLLRPSEKKPVTYEGIYSSFDEVFLTYENSTNYDIDTSLQEFTQKSQEELRRLETNAPPNLSYELIRLNMLSYLISVNSKDAVSVLDVGGGLGSSYMNTQYSCLSKKVDFTVVELPDTVTAARQVFKDYNNIQFVEELPVDAINMFDVIHFGSSLQYFPDYRKTLTSCSQLQPELIVISSTPMGDADTFVCAQVNMLDRTIPMWVFNIAKITEIMEESGYRLIHKSINYYEFHNFSNYSGEEASSEQYSLVFKR